MPLTGCYEVPTKTAHTAVHHSIKQTLVIARELSRTSKEVCEAAQKTCQTSAELCRAAAALRKAK
jgi:hypothetical protein